MVTADVIREFRLLLRDFFDAQIEDWGDEANAPRFARIETFLDEHEDSHDELAELFLFAFFDLRDGLFELVEQLGTRLDPVRMAQEIDEFGQRRPRQLRAGKVALLHAALHRAIDTAPSPEMHVLRARVSFFFHDLDADQPLSTPYGNATVPPPTPRPARLAMLVYEAP